MPRSSWLAASLVLTLTIGCGGNEAENPKSAASSNKSSTPSGQGACGLLMQSEVDEIFGSPAGFGMHESLEDGVQLCSWPSDGDPKLLLQISTASADIRAAVDLGEGYRVADVSEMDGSAAMAIELAQPDKGLEESVAILAMSSGDTTVTVSPIGLGLREGTPQFERLKDLVGARLDPGSSPANRSRLNSRKGAWHRARHLS